MSVCMKVFPQNVAVTVIAACGAAAAAPLVGAVAVMMSLMLPAPLDLLPAAVSGPALLAMVAVARNHARTVHSQVCRAKNSGALQHGGIPL